MQRVFCSKGCKGAFDVVRKQGRSHIRRARFFGCAIEKVDRWAVFARDGYRCWMCNIETPRELSGTAAHNAPQLDHFVPLSKGGAHSMANTKCACRRCNMDKGDAMPENALLQRLRAFTRRNPGKDCGWLVGDDVARMVDRLP